MARNSGLKELAYQVGSLGSTARLLQRWLVPDGAAILMYHAVLREPLQVEDWCFIDEHSFCAQMQYLKRHCEVVPLRELPGALQRQSSRPVVALTFDDGYQNNYSVVFPILRDLGLSATIFLTTDYIDSSDTLWFCRLNAALAQTSQSQLRWDGDVYDTSTVRARAKTGALLQRRLKELEYSEFLRRTRELAEALGAGPPHPVPRGSPYRMLCTGEIRDMIASGLIEFGAHTCSHAILSGLTEAERCREIADSLQAVKQLTGGECRMFAYPNGRARDYGPYDVTILKQNGVDVAVTTIAGPTSSAESPLEMRRYGIGADTSFAHFKLLAHHVLWKLRS